MSTGPCCLNSTGVVYVISIEEPLLTKIGFTTNLGKRREQYLSHYPLAPDFAHTEEGTVAVEKRAQLLCKRLLKLKGDLRTGEWFQSLSVDVAVAAIDEAKRQLAEEAQLKKRQDAWSPKSGPLATE